MSSRNCLGQFEKGVSGNPKGRPRKEPRRISDEKLREDFFDAAEPLSQLWKAESVSLSRARSDCATIGTQGRIRRYEGNHRILEVARQVHFRGYQGAAFKARHTLQWNRSDSPISGRCHGRVQERAEAVARKLGPVFSGVLNQRSYLRSRGARVALPFFIRKF